MTEDFYPDLSLLIDGEWVHGGNRPTQDVINPASRQPFARLPLATCDDIDAAAAAASRGFELWRRVPAYERARIMALISKGIRAQDERLSQIITQEQGKPLAESLAEVRSSADNFDWMAEEGKRAYGRIVPARPPQHEQYVKFEPVGPVAAFSPWNFPASLASRKLATALAAGCSIVLKPAEEAPGIMVAIARICQEAGLPKGVLNLLFGVPADVSARLIASPLIKKISFTGSIPVGRHLATLAGAQMKKITLELGGHAPVIVMDDADIDQVVNLSVAAKFRNAGQLCVCPTRFYVHASVHDRFAEAFGARARALRVGDGFDRETRMGPLANARRVQAMESFCEDAIAKGARVASGGHAPKGLEGGFYWSATVLSHVSAEAAAMTQEPFGPLALVAPFEHIEDAVAQANALDVGLAAYAFTSSMRAAHFFENELQAGNVSINSYAVTAPEMPFAGIKNSGFGVEMGCEGLLEHMAIKSIVRTVN